MPDNDYVEVSVTPDQYKALKSEGYTPQLVQQQSVQNAPLAPSAIAQRWPEAPVKQEGGQVDIGPAIGGFFKGLGRGATADIYHPEISKEEQAGANAGDFLGMLGTNAVLGLGGAALGSVVPGAGTAAGGALGTGTYAGVRAAQEDIHAGKPINWGNVAGQSVIGGALGAVAPGEGSLITKGLKGAAIGGLGNAASNTAHQYFENGGHVDPNEVLQSAGEGAALGAFLPAAERGLGHVFRGAGTKEVPGAQLLRDPETGLLKTPSQSPEIQNTSANLENGSASGQLREGQLDYSIPGAIEGSVKYEEPHDNWGFVSEGKTDGAMPWDEAPAPERNPETGAVQQPTDLEAQKAAIQQRIQTSVANQAAAHQAQAEQVAQAQGAIHQMQARRQALAEQQRQAGIQQKANEIHTRLTNYEKMGAKSQANKLRAEIAEQAATHQDPNQRQAYQMALDSYTGAKENAEALRGNARRVQETGNVGEGSKDQSGEDLQQQQNGKRAEVNQQAGQSQADNGALANESKGQVKLAERQQPSQRPQEGQLDNSEQQPKTEQEALRAKLEKRVPATDNIKPPHAETNSEKTKGMIENGLKFPDLVGVPMEDGSVQLITGSHRFAALKEAGEPIQGHVYMMKPEDVKGDWHKFQAEVGKTQDFNGLVDRLYPKTDNAKLKSLLKDQTRKADRAKTGELIEEKPTQAPEKIEKPKEEPKKKEVDQAALDELYKEHPKESIFKTKPQGTEQREHFLEAQAHKEGKFQHPHEIENDPAFIEAHSKLKPEEQEKISTIADAITNKKKLSTGFYSPGTEAEGGVLTKRAEHGQELYTPKGLSVTKKGDILVHGYNENAELSSRRLDRFKGSVTKTTESGYEGLYKHSSDINNEQTFHPADAIVEQVSNPILKKQVQGKPIVESDYRQAYQNLRASFSELRPELQTKETMKSILNRLPDPVKEYMQGGC